MTTKLHRTVAMTVAMLMLMLSIRVVDGKKSKTRAIDLKADVIVESGIEDGMNEVEQEIARLCIDDPYLKYLHFNVNLGSTSFKDCVWVGENPRNRCLLQASNGLGNRQPSDGSTPSLLQDICPLACGLCPTAPLEPETELDRSIELLSTDDLTAMEIKKLEEELRRQKSDEKKQKKTRRKPCPCTEGGNLDVEDVGTLPPTEVPSSPPSVTLPPSTNSPTPTPTLNPTTTFNPTFTTTYYPTFSPTSTFSPTTTFYPTFNPTVSQRGIPKSSTMSPTVESTTSGTYSSTFSGTYSSTFSGTYSSTISGTYTTSSILGTTSIDTSGTTISGQESSLGKSSTNKRLAVVLSVVPILLLLLVFCCLRRKLRGKGGGKGDEDDTDDSDEGYPIHETKSAESSGSRFFKVLEYFNGREDDDRTDVHRCSSVVCDVCNPSPPRVVSVGTYNSVLYGNSTLEEKQERYKVREVEC